MTNEPISEQGAAIDITPTTPSKGLALEGQRKTQTIRVSDLQYSVEIPESKGVPATTRNILRDVNITIPPSSLTAVMGSTGAGKTTMLNMLANRITPTSGSIKLNGRDYATNGTSVQQRIGYVMQDDKLNSTETVREALMFGARLLLPESTPMSECQSRVQNIIEELGLQEVADQLIGAPAVGGRGISGGERKRVAIGLVLIPDPDILLLDEPTTGLDSFTAESVTDTLRELAHAGRTVICTIHQPSSGLFKTFTDLLLMAAGRVVYFGKAEESIHYFGKNNYEVPQYTNPPDYYMKLLRTGLTTEEKGSLRNIQQGNDVSARLADLWADHSASNKSPTLLPEEEVDQDGGEEKGYAVGFGRQFGELMMRNVHAIFRNPRLFKSRIISSILLGCIVGIVFFRQDDEPAGVRAKQGAIFFMLINLAMTSLHAVTHTFAMELSLVMREAQANMYSISAYYWSKTLSEIPFMMLFPLLYSTSLYFLVGLRASAEAYFSVILMVILLGFVGQSFGMLISAAAPSMEMALVLGPLVFLPMSLASGFLTTEIPVWLIWLEKASFVKWAFEGAAYAEFNGRTLDCPENLTVPCLSTGDMVLEELEISDASVWKSAVILVSYYALLRILTWLVLLRRVKNIGGIQQ